MISISSLIADALDDGEQTLASIAKEMNVQIEPVQRAPAFRRFLLRRADRSESLVVDLVRDEAPQIADKLTIAGIVVDSPEEILTNKLCARSRTWSRGT